MTTSERRKIVCSVTFHIIAITCVVWSLYVLIDRTAEEIKQGNDNGEYIDYFLLSHYATCRITRIYFTKYTHSKHNSGFYLHILSVKIDYPV